MLDRTRDRTVEFLRRDTGIETRTEIFIAPNIDAEIRQVTLTNFTAHTRSFDLTSYAEVVLDTVRSDAAHPAFGKLFIESEFASQQNALFLKTIKRQNESGSTVHSDDQPPAQ